MNSKTTYEIIGDKTVMCLPLKSNGITVYEASMTYLTINEGTPAVENLKAILRSRRDAFVAANKRSGVSC